MDEPIDGLASSDEPSCDSHLSRKEFLRTVIRRAAVAGAILAAPRVVDKFLVPPVYAGGSTGKHDTGHGDTSHQDTGHGDTGGPHG